MIFFKSKKISTKIIAINKHFRFGILLFLFKSKINYIMTRKKPIRKKSNYIKPPFFFRISTYLYLLLGLLIAFLIYIFYRISISSRNLYVLNIIPLFLGIIYENKRLSTDWKMIALKAIGALVLSLFFFFPGKNESVYNFENHIILWQFGFLVIFVLISVFIHDQKVIPKLTEGITLMQSLSILYWIVDFNFFETKNLFLILLIFVSFLVSFYSIIHAFTNIPLTRNSRLFLSIWSSIIMIVFSFEHIFRVFTSPNIEDSGIFEGLLLIIQYFLLGVSSMYILQNLFMLIEYLPSKQRFYNKLHRKEIKIMNNIHIGRYSDKQVKFSDATFCFVYCVFLYTLNYLYNFIPRHTAIWIVFLTFPIVLSVKDRISKEENF